MGVLEKVADVAIKFCDVVALVILLIGPWPRSAQPCGSAGTSGRADKRAKAEVTRGRD